MARVCVTVGTLVRFWNLISQSFFAVPADYAEQRVIAKSLAELDDLITLHQRKRLWFAK